MFGKNKSVKSTITCLIGAGTHIEGNVLFQGGLRVDGHIKGNIYSDAEHPSILVISEHARIDGEVHGSQIVVNGLINGAIYASGLLELQPKARVSGNVYYKGLEMHNGAIVRGQLENTDEEFRPALKLLASNQS